MFSSKWDYMMCGFCVGMAFLFALAHEGLWLAGECLFVMWMWNTAEKKRKIEELFLIEEYEKSKSNPE